MVQSFFVSEPFGAARLRRNTPMISHHFFCVFQATLAFWTPSSLTGTPGQQSSDCHSATMLCGQCIGGWIAKSGSWSDIWYTFGSDGFDQTACQTHFRRLPLLTRVWLVPWTTFSFQTISLTAESAKITQMIERRRLSTRSIPTSTAPSQVYAFKSRILEICGTCEGKGMRVRIAHVYVKKNIFTYFVF